jgi:hypothetical protein
MESDKMESRTTPEIVQALIKERYRLEASLRSNPDFRRLEAVLGLIDLYERVAEVPTRADLVADADLSGKTVPSDRMANPDLSTTTPSSHSSTAPDPPAKRRRGGWTRNNSQTARILAAATAYLRAKGRRAKGTEISRALVSNGVTINTQKPSAIVAARLSSSPIFDHAAEGYGLPEWSNRSAGETD